MTLPASTPTTQPGPRPAGNGFCASLPRRGGAHRTAAAFFPDDRLYVVPCSATKSRILASQPMPARDAYAGQLFRLCRAALEREGLKWCILSAHYGFIWPTTVIEWYDVKMTPVTEATVWDDCFGHITNRQFARLMTAQRVMVLGSRLYADAAAALLKRPVSAPVAGLPIGRMLAEIRRGHWLQIFGSTLN